MLFIMKNFDLVTNLWWLFGIHILALELALYQIEYDIFIQIIIMAFWSSHCNIWIWSLSQRISHFHTNNFDLVTKLWWLFGFYILALDCALYQIEYHIFIQRINFGYLIFTLYIWIWSLSQRVSHFLTNNFDLVTNLWWLFGIHILALELALYQIEYHICLTNNNYGYLIFTL